MSDSGAAGTFSVGTSLLANDVLRKARMDALVTLVALPGCLGLAFLLEWGALKVIVAALRPEAQVLPKIFRHDLKVP